jgi:hypothetical protein
MASILHPFSRPKQNMMIGQLLLAVPALVALTALVEFSPRSFETEVFWSFAVQE